MHQAYLVPACTCQTSSNKKPSNTLTAAKPCIRSNSHLLTMKPVTQTHHTESNLVRANAAFRNKDLESAIALYEDALSQAAAPLNAQIRFNLNLALRRLGRPATSVAASLDHKESGADKFISDKL